MVILKPRFQSPRREMFSHQSLGPFTPEGCIFCNGALWNFYLPLSLAFNLTTYRGFPVPFPATLFMFLGVLGGDQNALRAFLGRFRKIMHSLFSLNPPQKLFVVSCWWPPLFFLFFWLFGRPEESVQRRVLSSSEWPPLLSLEGKTPLFFDCLDPLLVFHDSFWRTLLSWLVPSKGPPPEIGFFWHLFLVGGGLGNKPPPPPFRATPVHFMLYVWVLLKKRASALYSRIFFSFCPTRFPSPWHPPKLTHEFSMWSFFTGWLVKIRFFRSPCFT